MRGCWKYQTKIETPFGTHKHFVTPTPSPPPKLPTSSSPHPSNVTMGTRSRVILKRSTKPHIYLWMHYDGYWEGQGSILCESLRTLLETYTAQDLETMLEALDIPDLGSDYQCFCGTKLADFLLGNTRFKNDDGNDIEYEYVIDMSRGIITGQHFDEEIYTLSFDALKSHIRFEHIVPRH